MGKYFWKQQFDLPKGAGYAPFGPEHVATLLVIAVLITGCTILLIRAGRGRQERFIRWFPWTMARQRRRARAGGLSGARLRCA